MKRRLLTIGLALVLAVIGTSGVLAYVKQADARAITGLKAVSVLVAQKLIPSGTSAGAALRGGLLAAEKLPVSSVPSGAVRSVTGALVPLVTSAAIQPGQLLLRAMLVKTAVHAPGGVTLPPGMIEVTIAFCLPEMVAGSVQAGSQVAVFDTVGTGTSGGLSAGPACTGSHQQELGGAVRTRVVLPRVQVMSVGTASAGGSATPAPAIGSSSSAASGQGSTLVTLAVSQANAERLIQLSEIGLPYLALLTADSVTTADSGVIARTSAVVTPVVTHSTPAPTPTPAAAQPSPAPKPTIIIIKPCPAPAPAPTHPSPALPRLRPALTYPTPSLTAAAAISRQR
jgi:pilus assembly protein CpaB